jgi:hypothetical protein
MFIPGTPRRSFLSTLHSRSRWFALWYFAIALGFVLLAINRALVGEKAWLIVLRLVIAAGFSALGYAELKSSARK